MIFAHQIALDLTADQETFCTKAAGTARFTYNWALAHWKMQYRSGEKPTAAKLKVQWNAIKYERYPWVDEVHRDAHSQPFANLSTAFTNYFRHIARVKQGIPDPHGADHPTFKKKGQHDSFYIANDKCQVDGKRLRIPKLGWVRMREALRFTGTLMSVTVSRIADRWFASFAVRIETMPMSCENQAVVGVDLGVLTLATLSTGERMPGPKPLRKLAQALRRCSKGLSRKVLGSANRAKAKGKVAKLHYRIACQRKDTLHKLTTGLVQRFGMVVIEDLNVKGMAQNHHLARAISDMGFGRFRAMLGYKAEAAGVTLVVADRWYPSSKLCSQCGCLKDTLSLADRTFYCDGCGFTCDRDLNAALNLQNYLRLVGTSSLWTEKRWQQRESCCETSLDEAGTTNDALVCTL
jgi:putative transposase